MNHLLFMDDLKLYSKNVEELDTLVQTVRVLSDDIGMAFGIDKYAMTEMKRGKVVSSDGTGLSEGERIQSLEEDGDYKYLGSLESNKIESEKMKILLKKE